MDDILIGRNDDTAVEPDPHFGNRRGMLAGATGTGKTVSLVMKPVALDTPLSVHH